MSRVKGSKKTGGRQKGTPNKRTLLLNEKFEEMGVDLPERIEREIRRLKAIERRIRKKFPKEPERRVPYIKSRLATYLELMNYMYPKRKAIELTGQDGGPLDVYLRMTPEERAAKRAELEARLRSNPPGQR